MARAVIIPEDQIGRINKLASRIEGIQNLDLEILKKRPHEKAWSSIEVVEHMILGHKDYVEKINQALAIIQEQKEPIEKIRSRAMPSFLIKRFPPKEGKIRFKMKTMKRFYPVFDLKDVNQEKAEDIFKNFFESLDHLMNAVEQYRTKDATSHIFPSAVGAWVRFNVAEAIEFIICHNERHMQQIENVLSQTAPTFSTSK